MDEIYVNPNNDYLSYLEHHGIKGQKWGVRNAAWYPIAAFKAASDKVGTKVHEFKKARATAKKRKQRLANLQKAREARAKKAQEEKDFAEEKKRILTSGTPGEVVKFAPHLTNQEVQDAMIRNTNLSKLRDLEKARVKEIADAEYNKKWGKLDKIAKTVDKVGGYAKSATTAYTNFKSLMKLLNPETSSAEVAKQLADQKREQKKEAKQEKKAEKQQQVKQESYKQTVEDAPKYNNHSDKDQRGEFKSKVVDADWSEIVNPENVSTALTVVSKAMNSYDSRKSSQVVRELGNLLEDHSGNQFLLEDKNKK